MTVPRPTLPVRTERLVLRPARPDDVGTLHDYLARADVCRYLPHGVQTREQCAARIETWARCLDPRQPDEHLLLFVEHEGRHVGHVILFLRGAELSKGEVGWALHPDVCGRGLATEAGRALVDLCFGHYGMHRVSAQLDARNTASARVCRRLGMRQEALLRRDYPNDGGWADTQVFAVLRDEWG
ncbi:GNAT family N-acetyltransferase [uncultured Nocardioides sp.]|uniref:N-acetyltransferase domain-containing protein n=1 Tax=uncultured Nocardioides sp. TaxID=198441 RepID=A0A6J4NBW5_9ACTN|nr:GNAT family N-acetyltransferase [uncultured Nocardioides sp.]CAA9383875.1 MAG: hypothetical protein AVDCRST_MAG06-1136 [uncultured Nocardioides sp.]